MADPRRRGVPAGRAEGAAASPWPLALATVAARAAAYPHFPLRAIITTLRQAKGTLAGFRDDDALDGMVLPAPAHADSP